MINNYTPLFIRARAFSCLSRRQRSAFVIFCYSLDSSFIYCWSESLVHSRSVSCRLHANSIIFIVSAEFITTQLHWQRSEDPHGNPWLAIVIDPLYSLSTGKPQMQAFRVYPPDYSPPANETPDGRIVRNDTQRVAQWGVCWNRYYVLQVEFYMSRLAQDMLSRLKNRFLWAQALLADGPGAGSTSGTTHADEARTMAALTGRLQRLSGAGSGHRRRGFGGVTGTVGGTVGGNLGNVLGLGLGAVASGSSAEEGEEEGSSGSNVNMQRVAEGVAALGGEHVCRVCALLVKQTVFCLPSHREEQEKRENSSSANANSGNSGMEVV